LLKDSSVAIFAYASIEKCITTPPTKVLPRAVRPKHVKESAATRAWRNTLRIKDWIGVLFERKAWRDAPPKVSNGGGGEFVKGGEVADCDDTDEESIECDLGYAFHGLGFKDLLR
jgi:hypothetical protein